MITGKHSAIIGFGLFFYAVLTIMVLIGCCLASGAVFTVVGIANTLINTWVAYKIYKFYADKE